MSSNQPPPYGQGPDQNPYGQGPEQNPYGQGPGQNPYGQGDEPTRHAGSQPPPSGPPQQYGAAAGGQGGYGQGAPGAYGQGAPGAYGQGGGYDQGGGYGGPGGPGGQGGPGGPPKKSRAGLFAILGVVLLLIAGGALALVLTLGGDDDSDDSAKDDESTSESSESPSEETSESEESTESGETDPAGTVSGTGYDYAIPEGWSDVTTDVSAQEASVDTAIAAGSSIQGANANIIVESGPAAGQTSPESARATWKSNLESSTGTKAEDIDNGEIGGEDAIGVRIDRTNENGVDIVQIGYLTIKDDKVVAITISTTTDNESEALSTWDEVSSSWSWQ